MTSNSRQSAAVEWLKTYAGKRVLVTGHTGFKGAWLCEWLLALGAEVHGWSLPPQTPSLFETLDLARRMHHLLGDVRQAEPFADYIHNLRPEFIFHLAAQPLVRLSYREPLLTVATNVLGTTHLLEAVRTADFPCSVVVITTDKCYENDGRPRHFREEDPLGGHDPYSASKAAAELMVATYRQSFFSDDFRVALASVRAGNVIGGGDWAADRIVPDAIRALQAGRPVPVRNPSFTRPWQHVLEPLGGYLLLGARLNTGRAQGSPEAVAQYAQAFNFGPEPECHRSVCDLVDSILQDWPGRWEQAHQESRLREAPLLSLAIDRAKGSLGWHPRWDFPQTVRQTVAWYREYSKPVPSSTASDRMISFTRGQIAEYEEATASGHKGLLSSS